MISDADLEILETAKINVYGLIRPELEAIRLKCGDTKAPRLSVRLTPKSYSAEERNTEGYGKPLVSDSFEVYASDRSSARIVIRAWCHAGTLFQLFQHPYTRFTRNSLREIMEKELDSVFTNAGMSLLDSSDYTAALKYLIDRYEVFGNAGEKIIHSFDQLKREVVDVKTIGKDSSYVELGYPLQKNVKIVIDEFRTLQS